jgi:phage shock protein PspC (stress-responsive transcriptional regulator)
MTNKLHRNTTNKMLGGVCATISDRTNVDLNIVRLVTAGASVLSLALFGLGLTVPILYVLAWILIPAQGEEVSIAQRWFAKPEVQDKLDSFNKKL